MLDFIILGGMCLGLAIIFVMVYLYIRWKDKQTMRDYKNSQQFQDRRNEFIQRIKDKNKK